MSNADFFSLFPAEDQNQATDNADELTQLFDQNAPGDNAESAEAELDNFAVMFDEILLDGETFETDDQIDQGLNAAVMAIAGIEEDPSEFMVMEWDDADNGLTTDLGEIVADIENIEGMDDQDEPSDIFVPSLTPPFLQSYQTLQAQVAQLTAQGAIADQQLIAHQRRADSAEALIHQQASELTQAQEQLAHTVAELQVHQEEAKRQQLQIETLAEQLVQSQTQFKNLSDQLAQSQTQLAIVTTEKQALEAQVSQYPAQVSHLEKQVEELQHRLQRQQRYALQYKSALEQCLAQPDFHPSSDISQVVARLTGKTTDFQPWVSVGDVLSAFPQSLPEEPLPTPQPVKSHVTPGIPQPPVAPSPDTINPPQPSQPEAVTTPAPTTGQSTNLPDLNDPINNDSSQPRVRRPMGPDTLSFAVREQKKPPYRHVELPNFLARAVSVSR